MEPEWGSLHVCGNRWDCSWDRSFSCYLNWVQKRDLELSVVTKGAGQCQNEGSRPLCRPLSILLTLSPAPLCREMPAAPVGLEAPLYATEEFLQDQ